MVSSSSWFMKQNPAKVLRKCASLECDSPEARERHRLLNHTPQRSVGRRVSRTAKTDQESCPRGEAPPWPCRFGVDRELWIRIHPEPEWRSSPGGWYARRCCL